MNPALRVVLTAVPVLSVGLLAWLPFVWLLASRPKDEHPYGNAVFYAVLGTAAVVAWVVMTDKGSPAQLLAGAALLSHIAACSTLVWVRTGAIAHPVKDPYA